MARAKKDKSETTKKPDEKEKSASNPVGSPSKYNPEYCQKAYEFCLLGATNKELADHFGVALSTLQEWKLVHPEFSDAIKRGKTPADATVANALYERAKGAKYKEQQAFKLKKVIYENGKKIAEEERIEVVELDKEVPPDTTAAIKWLSNRRSTAPADSIPWRDKVDIDANVKTSESPIDPDKLDEATKQKIAQAYIASIEGSDAGADNSGHSENSAG